jgi:hypothetical protein
MCRGGLIKDDGLCYPKMYPHSFEEDLGSGLCCDALLAGDHNRHIGKLINHHEKHSHFPA